MYLIQTITEVTAFTILPNKETWLLGAILILVYGLVALFWGFKRNFLQFQLLKSPLLIIQIIITSFFAPALLEEIVFRVFFFPQPTQNLAQLSGILVIINLLIFIIYHPLNAFIFFTRGRETFSDNTFLSLAALLGMICIIAYWQSASLWLPVIIHWLIVITWLICFGGYNRFFPTEIN
jgi:predicted Abi (CAAX) family protease